MDPASLPLPQRLALTYAPAAARQRWLAILAFDHQLGSALAQAREPLLKQMRLAWWRDTLASPVSADPLRSELARHFPGETARLLAAVDGWEELTAPPPLSAAAIERYARGRAEPFVALAGGGDCEPVRGAAMLWALGDFAAHASDPVERDAALDCARAVPPPGRLARTMRPLAVLAALAGRVIERGETSVLGERGAALTAMRVGIFGR
jgi:15-cis-phytoene synthase